MTGVTIRPASRGDLDGALALWTLLQREHEAQDPRYRMAGDAAARWTTDFRTWTRGHSSGVWVAEEADGTLVGLLTAHLAEPAPMYQGEPFVFVGEIVVAAGWRGRGVGGALLNAARDWGREVGAKEIRAGVLAANSPGQRFWEQEGGRAFSTTVIVPLDPPRQP